MKKRYAFLTVALLASLVLATSAQSKDPGTAVKDKLKEKGLTEVVSVKAKNDSITELDVSAKPKKREPQMTLVVDAKYNSSTEVNEKYGDVISDVYGNKKEYKKDVGAKYIQVNIYRGDELVAYMAINENDERSVKVLDHEEITVLGMGMSVPPALYQQQQELIKEVKAKGL